MRLRVLEAVTDRSLKDLDLDKLPDILLRQVQELFEVDTVTVLQLDASGEQLVATATVSLDEEVFQGVRVPVGAGFAGRVAQLREPVQLTHVDESTVINPLLWERGLHVMLGVPMIAQHELVGVLHVGSIRDRHFSDHEIELLQLVADRLAMAAHAHRYRAERAAAGMLQESLLPAHLPAIKGWEFAARYVPGADSGVGGDWYDVFELPGDRIGLVIGDVVGNGLAAAVVMGRLRSALRAYALEFDDPGEVVGKLDRKASHFEPNKMATVAYAVMDLETRRIRLALAGHLPPLLAIPGSDPHYLDAHIGPPIGYNLGVTGRRTLAVEVPAGALIAFYTDGLVERRGLDMDERMELLRTVVTPHRPETVCARVMAAMVGTTPANDDTALIVVRAG